MPKGNKWFMGFIIGFMPKGNQKRKGVFILKKAIKICLSVIAIFALIFFEYRFIMLNIHPCTNGNTVYIEIFGQVDEYEAETID